MIRLTRRTAPTILDAAFVTAGVSTYIATGKAVWNHDEIKTALLQMSHGKCAYCELELGYGATYVEVEHFYAKDHHPTMVLDWDNLLPVCRRCNANKSSWDVAVAGQMIVDPVSMAPPSHIRLDEAYRPIGLSNEGENSIIELGLDDIPRLGVLRYKVGETFKKTLIDLYNDYNLMPLSATVRQRRAKIRAIKKLLQKSGEDQPFSAVLATVMMRSTVYANLKAALMAANEWDLELDQIDATASRSALL